jgi:hypothetical protein
LLALSLGGSLSLCQFAILHDVIHGAVSGVFDLFFVARICCYSTIFFSLLETPIIIEINATTPLNKKFLSTSINHHQPTTSSPNIINQQHRHQPSSTNNIETNHHQPTTSSPTTSSTNNIVTNHHQPTTSTPTIINQQHRHQPSSTNNIVTNHHQPTTSTPTIINQQHRHQPSSTNNIVQQHRHQPSSTNNIVTSHHQPTTSTSTCITHHQPSSTPKHSKRIVHS